MDLRGIEIFLAICDKGSMTAAAQSLGLTQAAVSQHLAKLEKELGLVLVDRNVRPPRLTAAGEYLRKSGQAILNNLSEVRGELLRYRTYDIPSLRLGIIESAASALLPSLVPKLAGRVGSLSVTSGTTHPLMPELRRGGFDMLISSEQIDDDETLVSECLLVEPILLILPKGREAPQNWDDMAAIARELDFIRYGERRRIGRIVNHLLNRKGLDTRGSLSFDSSMILFEHVKAGLGWGASTPMCMLSGGITSGDVEICRFPGANPIRSINAIWPADREGIEMQQVAGIIRSILAHEIRAELQARAADAADQIHVSSDELLMRSGAEEAVS